MPVSNNPFHRATYLTGPTAAGKTAVGVALAKLLNAEVVALDSMTLYRGMDIGTAKPTLEECEGIPHHLIDVLDPHDAASVADYRSMAVEVIAAIEAKGKRVLFVGGTALYLKALLRGLFEGPAADLALREDLEREAQTLGDPALHARLARIDPVTAARLHPNDRRRVIRALEVAAITGLRLSELQKEHGQLAPEDVQVIALERDREELNVRIDLRVSRMFDQGLIEEVRRLMSGPRPLHIVPPQGVGYREVIDFLAGRASLVETVADIQLRTRQFAKRQRTWVRGLAEVKPWPVTRNDEPEDIARRIAEVVLPEN